jgi:hypothetical protein
MVTRTKIQRALYDCDGRKYIELEGIGRVKVPFRYGRIMCKVLGDKTVQEMGVGLSVEVHIDIKIWEGVPYKILYSIKEI